jgi:hypothetical protein
MILSSQTVAKASTLIVLIAGAVAIGMTSAYGASLSASGKISAPVILSADVGSDGFAPVRITYATAGEQRCLTGCFRFGTAYVWAANGPNGVWSSEGTSAGSTVLPTQTVSRIGIDLSYLSGPSQASSAAISVSSAGRARPGEEEDDPMEYRPGQESESIDGGYLVGQELGVPIVDEYGFSD